MPKPIAVEVRDAKRVYGGTTALAGASLAVRAGEVHGLLGENGAGKSTLVRLLAGLEPRDGGEIAFFGEPMPAQFAPEDVVERGVAFIHQDLGLVENLSVTDNIAFVRGYPRRGSFIDYDAARAQARETLRRVGLELEDVDIDVGRLSLATRALIAIARALSVDARMIVLDEPTASLQAGEAADLFDNLRSLAAHGVSCLVISHRMDEIMRFCDRVTVLRNGIDVASRPVAEVTRDELISLIIGQALPGTSAAHDVPPHNAPGDATAQPKLSLVGLVGEATGPLDARFEPGTVTAITGLADAGHISVARQICGLEPVLGGHVTLDGREFRPRDIKECLAAGIGYVPPDRLSDGLAPGLTLTENLFMNPQNSAWWRPASVGAERRRAQQALETALVDPPEPDRAVSTLSGGNQQKVLLARALVHDPEVLVLCEPTAGVDVGAKQEIHRMIRGLARTAATTVILASSDFEEVADVSDRALVLSAGHVVADLSGPQLTLAGVTSSSYATTTKTERAR